MKFMCSMIEITGIIDPFVQARNLGVIWHFSPLLHPPNSLTSISSCKQSTSHKPLSPHHLSNTKEYPTAFQDKLQPPAWLLRLFVIGPLPLCALISHDSATSALRGSCTWFCPVPGVSGPQYQILPELPPFHAFLHWANSNSPWSSSEKPSLMPHPDSEISPFCSHETQSRTYDKTWDSMLLPLLYCLWVQTLIPNLNGKTVDDT